MLNQSEWNERLRQRIATVHHALETGQGIDRKLLVLVLANADALIDMYERQNTTIAKVHAAIGVAYNTPTNVQMTLDDYYTNLLAKSLHEAPLAPPIEYYRMWRRIKEVAELASKPRVDAALLAPYAKQLANDVDKLMTKVSTLEAIVKTQATDNAKLSSELEIARDQLAKPSHNCPATPQRKLVLDWRQIPSRSSIVYGAKLGEYIAEVRQLEDGTFRAWVRELSCVLRSDSGLTSLGVAQAIAEKWLKDILAKKMDELRALQSVFDDMGLFAVGDVVKASGGSFGIVVAKRGDLIRVVFDDGVRLGIIPNMSLDDAEPIIQHVTPRRRVVVPPELDSHDVELRRMLARDILVNNKGTTT